MTALFLIGAGLCAGAAYIAWDRYDTVSTVLFAFLAVLLVVLGVGG